MSTLAVLFKDLARIYHPTQSDLQELDDAINNSSHIDDIMFAKGEYIGGMASTLLAIIEVSQQMDADELYNRIRN